MGGEGLKLGSGVPISKLALGLLLRLRSLVGPILEIGTPDPRLQFASPFAVRLVGQVVQLRQPGQPIQMPAKQGFGDWLARLSTRRAARISVLTRSQVPALERTSVRLRLTGWHDDNRFFKPSTNPRS